MQESRDFRVLVAFREARDMFIDDLVAYARAEFKNTQTEDQKKKRKEEIALDENDAIDIIRGENTYQMAEFFYQVKELKLANKTKFRQFLLHHNDEMNALALDPKKPDVLGITRDKIREAIFSDDQIETAVELILDGNIRLDQASLGRLLRQLMAPETTRKVVVALSKGGFVSRMNIRGAKLIISNGTIERYFKKHLLHIADNLAGIQAI